MRLICRVAADFTAPDGSLIFSVKAHDRMLILEAPDAIKDTLMFKLLKADGSIEFVEKKDDQKKLENDPVQGAGADGRKKPSKRASKASKNEVKEEVTEESETAQETEIHPEEG